LNKKNNTKEITHKSKSKSKSNIKENSLLAGKENKDEDETSTRCYKLTREEKETLYLIDDLTGTCIAESSISKDINKLTKCNWDIIKTQHYSDGNVQSVMFSAPRKYLSVRTVPNKNEVKKKKEVNEEQIKKMQKGRKSKNAV